MKVLDFWEVMSYLLTFRRIAGTFIFKSKQPKKALTSWTWIIKTLRSLEILVTVYQLTKNETPKT